MLFWLLFFLLFKYKTYVCLSLVIYQMWQMMRLYANIYDNGL